MLGISVRRLLVAVMCLSAAAVGVSTVAPVQATPDGMAWGAYPSKRGSETEHQAILRMERASGRKFDVVRDFLLWNSPFPEWHHTWMADTGRTMILSVRAIHTDYKTVVPWADIAAARPGDRLYAKMVEWARDLKALGVPVYFSFNHEPETVHNLKMGTAPQFIAAWRNFHRVFAAQGVTNVKFMWIMTDYSFFAALDDRRRAEKWYPGDYYVHAVAADAYNWFTCRSEYKSPWKSLETIIAPFRDFGRKHPGEEVWLAEWATVEDPARPGRKAQWIRDAQALFKRADYAQFHGVSYFDSYKKASCPWPVETSASSLDAFADMGADPFYGGSG